MSDECVSCGARDAWEDDTLCRSCREWTNLVWNQAIEQAALITMGFDGLGRTGNRMREMIRKLKREKTEELPLKHARAIAKRPISEDGKENQ